MKFRVHVEPDEDGVFVAECPTLPGCISQGVTRDEALTNIKDAIAGYLVSFGKKRRGGAAACQRINAYWRAQFAHRGKHPTPY